MNDYSHPPETAFSTAHIPTDNTHPLSASSDVKSPPNNATASLAQPTLFQPNKRRHPLSPSSSPSPVQERSDDGRVVKTASGAPKEIIDSLRGFLLFKAAPESFLEAIASKLVLQTHPVHSFIITEGEEARAMYWIIRGSVGIVSRDGEAVHAELGPGAFFGEIGILFDCPRTASVQAREKCVLAALTAGALNEVLPGYPEIEQAIRDEAQERLSILEKSHLADQARLQQTTNRKKSVSLFNSHLFPQESDPTLEDNGPRSRKHSIGGLGKYLEHTGVREILGELPLFNKLPSTMIHKLALAIEPKSYGPFQMIIQQNTPGKDIYFIVDGQVEVLDENSQTIIARLSRGAYFGEMAFLSWSDMRTASVRTITECDCLVVTEKTLLSLCEDFPDFKSHIEETANLRRDNNQSQHIWQFDSIIPTSKYLSRKQSIGSLELSANRDDSEAKDAPQGKQMDLDPFHVKKSNDEDHSKDANENEEHGVGLFSKSWNTSGLFGSPSASALLSPPLHELGPHDSVQSSPSNHSEQISPAAAESSPHFTSPFDASTSNQHSLEKPHPPFSNNAPAPIRRTSIKAFPIFSGVTEPIPEEDETGGGAYLTTEPPTSGTQLVHSGALGVRRPLSHHGLLLHPRAKRVRQFARRRSSLFNHGPFPDFIQLKIFTYLDLKTLMVMRRVCQNWRQILQTSQQLVKELDLQPYNTTINDKSIISITNFAGVRPKIVNISNCFHLTDEGFSYLVNGIGLAKINVFKMKSVWEVSAMAIMDLTVPSIGSDLEEIDLSNCRKVGDSTLTRLIGWVVPPFGPDGQPTISPSPGTVVGCAKLRKISLSYCKHITDRSMYHMAMFASERVESLDLTRCTTITDHGFSFWTLRSFTALKHLCLADCTFLTDKAIIAIASAAKGLESLVLSFCCALTDVSVEVLALGCPALVTLDLAYCGSAVSDASLSTVALHLLELRNLSVRGCVRVTRTGVDTILMVAGSHNLRMLDITQCRNTLGPVSPPIDMITGLPRVTIKQ